MKKKNNRYTPLQKRDIVLESYNNTKYGDIKKIALKYNIHPNLLYYWRRRFFSDDTAYYVYSRKTKSPVIDLNTETRITIIQQQFLIESLTAELNQIKRYQNVS